MFSALVWNVDPAVFSFSPLPRWYGVLFAAGVISGFHATKAFNTKDGRGGDFTDRMLVYVIAGMVIGMRLAHCLFYQPEIYLANPIEILKIWHGGFASHGGFAGVMVALWAFTKSNKVGFLWLADRAAIGCMLTAAFIRLGNFFNSEMIGHPTDVPWAMIFEQVDEQRLPRHPAQLYEAVGYLLIFAISWLLYQKTDWKNKAGRLFGSVMIMGFTWRFLMEFFKIEQAEFEKSMPLNMGQLLSLPFIAIGILLAFGAFARKSDSNQSNR